MIDQREKFLQRGLNVEFVGNAQTNERVLLSVLSGEVQLVYISPESRLLNRRYRNMLSSPVYQEKLKAFIVDESHCVKFWLAIATLVNNKLSTCIFRGDEFRRVFADLGSIRSLLPSNINVMPLTATATKATLDCVVSRLGMQNPAVIGLEPDRPNITLRVEPYPDVLTLSKALVKELMEKHVKATKTVVFCRTLKQCADMCITMKKLLGIYITEPPGLPDNLLQFRLIDIFTAASDVKY